MEVENGPSNISFLSIRVISHFHDSGRKDNAQLLFHLAQLLLHLAQLLLHLATLVIKLLIVGAWSTAEWSLEWRWSRMTAKRRDTRGAPFRWDLHFGRYREWGCLTQTKGSSRNPQQKCITLIKQVVAKVVWIISYGACLAFMFSFAGLWS